MAKEHEMSDNDYVFTVYFEPVPSLPWLWAYDFATNPGRARGV